MGQKYIHKATYQPVAVRTKTETPWGVIRSNEDQLSKANKRIKHKDRIKDTDAESQVKASTGYAVDYNDRSVYDATFPALER